MTVALITPSFSRDFPLAKELCASVDRHNPEGYPHTLVVPQEDVAMFRVLESQNRNVIAQEPILDAQLFRLPLPTVFSIPGIFKKRLRKLWLTSNLTIVRGWIIQQVLKMSANRYTDANVIVFLDSDCQIVRDFTLEDFAPASGVPLLRVPHAVDPRNPTYQQWQDAACDLLGLPLFPFEGDSNVGTIVCWRRDRLEEMQAKIEEVTGLPYQVALMKQKNLSEYVVYSIFCRLVVGTHNGHQLIDKALCHEDWGYDLHTEDGVKKFTTELTPEHIGILIQSTQEWSMEKRRAVIDEITARAGL